MATTVNNGEIEHAAAPARTLEAMARKYVWWKDPAEALADRTHFLARIMTWATWEDADFVLDTLGAEAFREALRHAPPGIFNGRSWAFWHLRLGLGEPPPLPQRRIG